MPRPARKKRKNIKKISSEELRKKLKLKHLEAQKKLKGQFPGVDKFLIKKGIDPGKIRHHSAKVIGTGLLTGSLLLSPPKGVKALPTPDEVVEKYGIKNIKGEKSDLGSAQQIIINTLESVLPEKPRPLERNEEKFLEQVFEQTLGAKTRANLEGEHLNTTYGNIGAEQHLRRYPGDTLSQHIPQENDYGSDNPREILKEGMAPGLGAWGYFAPTRDKLTPDLEETERWYAVVQTLYLPDWNTRTRYLRDWYKYRKVLIVNTENGNAVVARIADSGPAAWTGKHFGGSPEVMDYLGGPKYKKGPVVLFFVDDPENKVPLGPVDYNK